MLQGPKEAGVDLYDELFTPRSRWDAERYDPEPDPDDYVDDLDEL